jgi:hypothetical protein
MSGLDLVPDGKTALKIGGVILERYYGDSLVRRYEFYRASPNPTSVEEWVVLGGREDKSVTRRGGGFPELSNAKNDARKIVAWRARVDEDGHYCLAVAL